LREALSLFVTGVTVISVRDPDTGQPRGMTANAFMSGSLEPPLVLVSVRQAAKLHPLLEREGYYGVSILADGMERDALRFAGLPLSDHEPAPRFRWLGNVPVLHDAMATLTARVEAAHAIGDHTLFVGAVGTVELADHDGASPLAYLKSTFVRVSGSEGAEPLPIDPWSGAVDAWG
jgi:flavin reductase (DIM6/NTAB) family NADH-FMN oxidoreductase RutF